MTGNGIQGFVRRFVFFFGIAGVMAGGLAFGAGDYGFQKDNHQITGKWQGGDQWKGRLCDGYYSYKVNLGAVLSTVDFELNDNGTIAVYADLRDLYGAADGVYRSQASVCIPMRGWTGAGIDRAEIFTEVKFRGEGENVSDIEVRVIATKLGTIHIGKYVPRWFERALTNVVNRALAKIWASRLGAWISGKIGDIIKDKIPVDAHGNFTRID